MHNFTVTTTSDESWAGNDDEVQVRSILYTVFQIFCWTVGKV